ncbi:molybdopterin-guanine dinucleotide biosynthesis protein A [Sneathiella sp. P13V-1]|uniref:molybdopterin-guanine dinucleotide biosynthesis protein A n=1 Tax=Sneathiella sp. P13V-1 TaxID=2697366 RepID=UPI00187BB20B|nr:molybdopterin-guanine dinucleotide biosynthesis protein A [Sneathiella sp. P13V-1]MBE7638433.1 molybdopterin-guanine dinucleotide biosynthesis protein A [Sneathiella sp. P13V-1]
MGITFKSIVISAAAFFALANSSYAQTNDRYIGYYYPAPQQIEAYCARVPTLKDVNKKRRVGFIIGIKSGQQNQQYESPYSVFAKGGQSTKLMIISKQEGYLNTIYRARALLADLSVSARTTPIFAKSGVAESLTFLDLISTMGFESVTLSDGASFSHQVLIFPQGHRNCVKAPAPNKSKQ